MKAATATKGAKPMKDAMKKAKTQAMKQAIAKAPKPMKAMKVTVGFSDHSVYSASPGSPRTGPKLSVGLPRIPPGRGEVSPGGKISRMRN